MKINIIAQKKWILKRIGKDLNNHMADSYLTIMEPDEKADINIYINYALFRNKSKTIDIGWFTHKENNSELASLFEKTAKEVDYCIAMSKKTALLLPAEKTTIIEPCISPQFKKEKIIFGCVGKNQAYNRKRFDLIPELEKINNKIEIRFTEGKIPFNKLPEFYKNIDYLLILSANEGGPMPVKEAIACGKPVIAPDVGWSWDFPVIKYNTIDELKIIMNKLIIPDNCWEITANKIYNLCKTLVNKRKDKSRLIKKL